MLTLNKLHGRYDTDIQYTLQYCHWMLKLLGIYPFIYNKTRRIERLTSIVLILVCCATLQFVIVPFGYYILFYERDINMKVKSLGPVAFCATTMFKYGYLGVYGSAFGHCIKHVKKDWKTLQDEDHRGIMIRYATMSRNLIKLCAVFLYTGGLSYHTIMPLLSIKTMSENFTVRPLAYPGYEAFFDIQESPVYEIVYCMHCFYVLVSGTITLAAYSLTALFTTHACGQIKIQTLRLENLTKNKKELEKDFENRIGIVIRDHVEILRFTRNVQNTLCGLFLIEVIMSTLLICLLEYYCMMEWAISDSIAISTYFILLIAFTFNILIFCYVGELLLGQGSEIANASYETEWYNLRGRKARDIVLLLAISKYPPKLTAGKMIILSLNTFGVVLKTSVVYLNMLRTIVE